MPYYTLQAISTPGVRIGVTAGDRTEAVAEFGRELGRRLTLEDQERPPLYMMAEHHEPEAHFVNLTIPVFVELPE